MKKLLLTPCLTCLAAILFAQTTIIVTKKRPPELDVSLYKQIAVGDITGSSGINTERSMDLSDALTSKLFNSNSFEVIDRTGINQILASQKKTEVKTINETTTAALSKKLNSALLITGRIQNEKVYTERKSQEQSIIVNGCRIQYWWEVSGDMTTQIKIFDVKTGKLLFSKPVIQPIKLETRHECEPKTLGDTEPLIKEAVTDLAGEIAKLILPYDQKITIGFETPVLSLKNPFKKLRSAIQSFNMNDNNTGIAILKEYAEDKNLKPTLHEMAVYNYGVALFIDNQYELAAEQFRTASTLGSLNSAAMTRQIEVEKQYTGRMLAKR